MGLTARSTGVGALDSDTMLRRRSPHDGIVALAGNPNVGKSTVFNALTGMKQHTGNWPGKTVTSACGYCKGEMRGYVLVDLPGTYSLLAHSAEEEIARNFICFESPDVIVAVCDATCPERTLNLVLQITECHPRVILCLNLMDEAKRKGIHVDLPLLQKRLGIPVVGVTARKKKTLIPLLRLVDEQMEHSAPAALHPPVYPAPIEDAARVIRSRLEGMERRGLSTRWLSLRLLEGDASLEKELFTHLGKEFFEDPDLEEALQRAREILANEGILPDTVKDLIGNAYVQRAEDICRGAVVYETGAYSARDRRLDRLFTGKYTAYPTMLLLLALVFWLTISLANYPSEWLSGLFSFFIGGVEAGLSEIHAPPWLSGLLVDGILGVLAQVISVMLPPMAIFFPLFTLLEDAGYLPRVAYNLDRPFCACNACGKQSLTMCMGLGCNAAGVTGCRIIDSPRERLLAILTNSLIPCNGRFPALIAILSMFFIGTAGTLFSGMLSAFCLLLLIVLSVLMTFALTKLLSCTLLRGLPSSFSLELPPFRTPQAGKVLVRSLLDRTLFVLGRSAAVAAPAGALLWCMANVTWMGTSLLSYCAALLDPFASILGLDGVILMAFVLGFPANEIVIPIIVMGYMNQGRLGELSSLADTRALLIENGWTPITALCVLIFFLFHWPCSTTLLTVKKETGSVPWTIFAALLPTLVGMLLCILIRGLGTFLGI